MALWRRHNGLNEDLYWGVGEGFRRARYYSAMALIVAIVKLVAVSAATMLALPLFVLGYFLAGSIAGAVVGLLRPLASSAVGYMLLGALAGVPVAVVFMALVIPTNRWGTELLWMSLAAAFLFGPFYGLVHWIRRPSSR